MRRFFPLLFIAAFMGFSLSACQNQPAPETKTVVSPISTYEVMAKDKTVEPAQAKQMIDVVALLENQDPDNIAEFGGGLWSIAVKNLATQYTYYYDSANNFLGRKK